MNQNLVKRMVLVAAQSFETRLTVGAALAEHGYSIGTVSNGIAAWTNLSSDDFDLLILSDDIPGFSSTELCSIIRETTSIPIIVYPGSENTADRLEAFEAGADDYITHHAEFDEVLARVDAVIRRSESNRSRQSATIETFENPVSAPTKTVREVRERVDESPAGSKLSAKYRNRPRDYAIEPGTSVLVVDSDPVARICAIRLLKTLGHFVIEADSCLQAILTVKRYKPRLLITELYFDHLDGFELI